MAESDEQFEKLMNDSGLTEESLQAELNRYSASLHKELQDSLAQEPENVEEYTRNFFKKNVHSAAAQIVWLSNNADSESVKFSASKYVVGMALEVEKDDKDPLKSILKSLTTGAKSN